MQINELFAALDLYQVQVRRKKLEEGIGVLRGGNAGIYEEGSPPSSCARKAIMRSWYGLEPSSSLAKQLIFDAGLNSEIHVVTELEEMLKVMYPGYSVLTQQECGVKWFTKNGTPVTGSPDFMLRDNLGQLVLGLELKNVNSVYKALSVLAEAPGSDALAQGGMYSWAHDFCPWGLVYTSKTQHHNLKYCFGSAAIAVRNADRYAHVLDWAPAKEKEVKGKMVMEPAYPKSLLGCSVRHELVWDLDTGCLGVRYAGLFPDGGHDENKPRGDAGQIRWTVITVDRIKAFYELCSEPDGPLPPRPANTDPFSGEKKGWDFCDPAYCEWAGICKKLDKCKGCTSSMMADMIREECNG